MKQYLEITYRDIAKLFAKSLPLEDGEFGEKVEQYLATVKALPIEAKLALKTAYVFGSKAPREEREDLFQDLALAVLEARTKNEKLAYTIARCDWKDWWSKYRIRQHYSLDSVIEESEGNAVTLAELIVGEVEFERKVNGKMDGERIWDQLPDNIKPLVEKRLMGKPLYTPKGEDRGRGRPQTDSALSGGERQRLNRWIKAQGYKILLASAQS